MKRMFLVVMAVMLILTLGLVGASCIPAELQTNPSPSPSPSYTGKGTVEVYVTDAPPEEQVTSVMVTVSRVEVHKAGTVQDQIQQKTSPQTQQKIQERQQIEAKKGEVEKEKGKPANPGQGQGQNKNNNKVKTQEQEQKREQEQEQVQQQEQEEVGGSWINIDITRGTTFDLLKIKGVEEFFGVSQVDAGKYTQVRLTIDKVEVGLGGKPAQEVKLPSGVLKIVQPFEVKNGETTQITLDFDAEKSVNVTGNGKVIVKPTVKLSVKQKTGGKPTEQKQVTEEESRKIAEDFVKKDETFAFDGMVDTLKLTKTEGANCSSCWAFTFEFDSRQAGYGNRTGQTLAQVITHHVAVVTVEQGRVTSAVMDGKWDMLREKETLDSQLKDTKKVNVDASFDGKEVEMAVGSVLVVTLDSNPTTGFRWVLKDITDKAVLENIGDKFNAPGQGGLAGQGGQEVWYFKALAVGKSTLTLEYRRPWEQGAAPAKTFTVTVNVKQVSA